LLYWWVPLYWVLRFTDFILCCDLDFLDDACHPESQRKDSANRKVPQGLKMLNFLECPCAAIQTQMPSDKQGRP
jgi:hypothetical protein